MRQYALVKLVEGISISESFDLSEDVYVFLGEIPNMKDHCVVIGQRSGKAFVGYHTENFRELSEDET